ncbi:MAG: PEGA domain-containing protein [Phycisphaerae bacterium]|nr:PEGA domain-containing protein [Phycisphaerae bacterium]
MERNRPPLQPESIPRTCGTLALIASTLVGCTERRMFITSEPSGALVTLNDVEIGSTPCEADFTYFGVYDVRLKKQGYEPLITQAEAKAPFHEWPGVDLVAMAIPVKKKTRIEWHFVLQPATEDRDALLERASQAREMLAAP